MKREGVSTLSIHGFPRALRYLLIFQIACVCAYFENVLLRFNPCFCLQEGYEVFLKTLFEKSVSVKKFVCFGQVPTSIYLLEKGIVLCLFPLDNAILLLVSR